MIALTPLMPYDPHSVWNRNQLGALSLSDPMTLAGIALVAYFLLKKGGLRKLGIG